MWTNAVAFFLGVSVLFYCLFAGADFGAGILEIFSKRSQFDDHKKVVTRAISPVWEANHMWIVLAIVILFNGFPAAYSSLSIVFHIPLTLILIGIILRGCAFTFGHYDAVKDESQKYYDFIFMLSSTLTPLMLGVVAGGMFLGRTSEANAGFYESYVSPWFNLFSLSMGVFTCVLFAFLAAVYLTGEARQQKNRDFFARRARILNVIVVLAGFLIFLFAEIDGLNLVARFLADPVSLVCMVLATLMLVPLWVCLRREYILGSRIFAGAQILFILLGWFRLQFPVIMMIEDSGAKVEVTFYNSAAPESTLRYLLYSLIVGTLIIFPALAYLLKIFKGQGASKADF